MNLALLLRSFALVFLAELGDKTQLTTLGLASSSAGTARPHLSIFLGSALALVCTSAIAALAGAWISSHVDMRYVKLASALLFFVFGALMFREALA
jgi:putative Ca2+/H+ antiporter (TMEM165/GDT1 family)